MAPEYRGEGEAGPFHRRPPGANLSDVMRIRRRTPPPRLRATVAAVVLTAVLPACAAPDRPPWLPDPLPARFRAFARPDSLRVVRVAPGVWYRYAWSPVGPWALHLVEADLRRCELGLDVVRAPDAEGRTGGRARVSDLAGGPDATSVLAAVNGDFYTPEGVPLGPELASGRLRTVRERPVLSWRPGRAPWIGTARAQGDSALAVGWSVPVGRDSVPGEVVGGYPELLDRGRPVGDLLVGDSPGFAASRHPRTAVGWSPARGRLWLVVVDGRQGGYSLGMTLPELADLFLGLGATEALNLDGGGSSVMLVRGRTVSRPSGDEGERRVVNALLVTRDAGRCAGGPGGR